MRMNLGALAAGLGTPTPTGAWDDTGVNMMRPGTCCYDPNRPWYVPSFMLSDAENACLHQTSKCSVASFTYTPATPALPCAIKNPDGSCAMGDPQVNNPSGIDLSAGQQTNQQKLDAAAQAALDSVTGLTPGGCPSGQDGTYPDCGTCSWYQTGKYPSCDSSSLNNYLLIGGLVAFALLMQAVKR